MMAKVHAESTTTVGGLTQFEADIERSFDRLKYFSGYS